MASDDVYLLTSYDMPHILLHALGALSDSILARALKKYVCYPHFEREDPKAGRRVLKLVPRGAVAESGLKPQCGSLFSLYR